MKTVSLLILAIAVAGSASAQQQTTPVRVGGATSINEGSNLPIERVGRDDLVGITVYDAPELTRTVRVGSEGDIRLPMLKQPIRASGLFPTELEKTITTALIDEHVLVEPIVTVSVVEYRSRPISVSGAVRHPVTFQATGTVTLLDAISQAEGFSESAGSEILISRKTSSTSDKSELLFQRISVRGLIWGEDPSLNLLLSGGEQIRVPEAGRVFVVGNVKKPGAFYITDGSESSVMKALALSEGLGAYSDHKAYIYRLGADGDSRNEIAVDLKKIMNRKSPDVPLMASDIFYVPDATGLRASMKVLETSLGLGAGLGSALIYTTR